MRRSIKIATLDLMRRSGIFDRVADSRWRRERLLILCYHGLSLENEHKWRPALFIEPSLLKRRLETLLALRCSVLPLSEALVRLRAGDLPPRSVVLTFDDGTYDFYREAFPLLTQYGLPATVYQTTYYMERALPVFNLFCSYLLWHRRGDQLPAAPQIGLSKPMDLQTELGRHKVVRALIEHSERENLTGSEKNETARQLAFHLGVDYEVLFRKRILQLMNAEELKQIANAGIDVQLHTHRHRTPDDEVSFRREISDNRARLESVLGRPAIHFCYPGGIHHKQFPEWLKKENVVSATTCDAGIVGNGDNPFLIPRVVDTTGRTDLEFESWVCGAGSLLALRKAAPQRYVVPTDSL